MKVRQSPDKLGFGLVAGFGIGVGKGHGVAAGQYLIGPRHDVIQGRPVQFEVAVAGQQRKIVELKRFARVRLRIVAAGVVGAFFVVKTTVFGQAVVVAQGLIRAVNGQQHVVFGLVIIGRGNGVGVGLDQKILAARPQREQQQQGYKTG